MKKTIFFLIALGIFLRVFRFGQLPLALNRDEAALGYNAFAIATEGIDEWGQKLPLIFKSFGDYKLPGYIYTLTPVIRLFGATDSTVRLPSLVAGLAIIPLLYLLALKMFANQSTARMSAVLIALTPWAVFYSRVAFEANVGLTLFIASLLFFMSKTTLKNSLIGLGLYLAAIMTYNTPLLLFYVPMLFIFAKSGSRRANLMQLALVFVVASSWFLATKSLFEQKQGITVFSDPTLKQEQAEAYAKSQNLLQKVSAHKVTFFASTMIKNTIATYAPNFAVMNGGANPWHGLPGSGPYNTSLYILLIASLLKAIFTKDKKSWMLIGLSLISLAPAVVTVDAPHVTRSLFAFVCWILLIAHNIPKTKRAQALILVIVCLEAISFGYHYFVKFPNEHNALWQVGLKEKIIKSQEYFDSNTSLVITNPHNQPYIYTLFYGQINPRKFRETVSYYGKDPAGIEYVRSYNNWLFIGDINDVPSDMPVIYQDKQGTYHLKKNKQDTIEL